MRAANILHLSKSSPKVIFAALAMTPTVGLVVNTNASSMKPWYSPTTSSMFVEFQLSFCSERTFARRAFAIPCIRLAWAAMLSVARVSRLTCCSQTGYGCLYHIYLCIRNYSFVCLFSSFWSLFWVDCSSFLEFLLVVFFAFVHRKRTTASLLVAGVPHGFRFSLKSLSPSVPFFRSLWPYSTTQKKQVQKKRR